MYVSTIGRFLEFHGGEPKLAQDLLGCFVMTMFVVRDAMAMLACETQRTMPLRPIIQLRYSCDRLPPILSFPRWNNGDPPL